MNDYWCLFCGETGPRWESFDELIHHMKTTVHQQDNGIVFFAGENDD